MASYPFISTDLTGAAKATGVSERSIEKAIAASDLVAHFLGTKRVFMARDLEDWIESLPTESTRRSA